MKGDDRWTRGVPHHPLSELLVRAIADIDFEEFNDYFCWKVGGDGDNGETLLYELDVYFEERGGLGALLTKARAEEREECAKVCEDVADIIESAFGADASAFDLTPKQWVETCVEKIRARGAK